MLRGSLADPLSMRAVTISVSVAKASAVSGTQLASLEAYAAAYCALSDTAPFTLPSSSTGWIEASASLAVEVVAGSRPVT